MKTLVALVFLINTLLDCMPIEGATEHSEVVHLLLLNFTDSEQNEMFSDPNGLNNDTNLLANLSRMTIPNDVEMVEPTITSEKQSVLPVVGTIIDMIFAVRFKSFSKCKIIENFKLNTWFLNRYRLGCYKQSTI